LKSESRIYFRNPDLFPSFNIRFTRAVMTGFDKFAATGAAAESPIATPEK
jgi:hypothetical protein